MQDDFIDLISHLTDGARASLYHANVIAGSYGSQFIGTEHLLLGILAHGSSMGAKILVDGGVTLEKAQKLLKLTPVSVVINSEAKSLSEMAKLTLRMGWEMARENNHEYLGTEHILYCLLSQKNSRAMVILEDLKIDPNKILADLDGVISESDGYKNGPSIAAGFKTYKKSGMLGLYGIDLTNLARDGKLDPIIGRKKELDRLVTILNRRTKNNPVLIGEPGVGKTAIVEGLAQKIIEQKVPDKLLNKRLMQLDLASMIAGTKYRGEFEERLKRTIDELKRQTDVVVFIDEIHLIVGAGSAEGSIDAANILKPSLARGEIRLIGATTLDEYRKHIEKDSALERRLQPIVVKEPNISETIQIVSGLTKQYEDHHQVEITDSVIEQAVYMADRYIGDRFMPDKVIDVIDEAAALRSINIKSSSKLTDINKNIQILNSQMEDAVGYENYEKAAQIKTDISRLKVKLDEMKKSSNSKKVKLTEDDIALAIAQMSGIPVSRLKRSEQKLYSNLEKHLGKFIIGQDDAIKVVSESIRRGRSGVSSEQRPIGSFVFMGPTGVGKTELAKVLAREVFGSNDALIKIDMSEFSEKHTASRLVGAPAGYVGYDDGGQLTDKTKRQPYSVVLFDEIEKAHKNVYNLLLQILEDGYLSDSKGQKVSFRNTIIILTSNLGSKQMMRESVLGFNAKTSDDEKKLEELHEDNSSVAQDALSDIMSPELINRFDAILTFRALTRRQVSKIFNNLIDELNQRLVKKGLRLIVEPSAKKQLIDKGYDEKSGARLLRRTIQDKLETKIAHGLLSNKYPKGSLLKASVSNKEIKIDVVSE